MSELAEIEEHILHSDRRTREQQSEDITALVAALPGPENAQIRDRVLHRWRSKDNPQTVLAEALAVAKAIAASKAIDE